MRPRRRHLNRAPAYAPETPTEDAPTTTPGAVSNRVIIVLGYHDIGDDGSHRISPICRAAVRRAESLAAETTPRAVIFTGWSSTGAPTEADQMAAAWNGRRDVALLREPSATNTAENAVRSLQLLHTIDGGSEVIAVCSIRHFPRARFFFNRLYNQHGYTISYRYVASPIPSPRLVLAELSSITRMARDRRHALGLLDETHPTPPVRVGRGSRWRLRRVRAAALAVSRRPAAWPLIVRCWVDRVAREQHQLRLQDLEDHNEPAKLAVHRVLIRRRLALLYRDATCSAATEPGEESAH